MTYKPNMKIVTTATQYSDMDNEKYCNIFDYSESDYIRGDACKSAIIKFLLDKGYTCVLEAVDGISIESYSYSIIRGDIYAINTISDAICVRLVALTGNRVDGLYNDLKDFMTKLICGK